MLCPINVYFQLVLIKCIILVPCFQGQLQNNKEQL